MRLRDDQKPATAVGDLLCDLLRQHSEASVLSPWADGPFEAELDLWLGGYRFHVTVEHCLDGAEWR